MPRPCLPVIFAFLVALETGPPFTGRLRETKVD